MLPNPYLLLGCGAAIAVALAYHFWTVGDLQGEVAYAVKDKAVCVEDLGTVTLDRDRLRGVVAELGLKIDALRQAGETGQARANAAAAEALRLAGERRLADGVGPEAMNRFMEGLLNETL